MKTSDEIARELVNAVVHTLSGKGPATVRLQGPHGLKDGAVVLIFPGPLGAIIDDALDKLYAHLGWQVQKQGSGEVT